MDLEKAKRRLIILLQDNCDCPECMKNKEAYKTALKALENSIPKEKVEDKIIERQFELQQEYKDFDEDEKLQVLKELLEEK